MEFCIHSSKSWLQGFSLRLGTNLNIQAQSHSRQNWIRAQEEPGADILVNSLHYLVKPDMRGLSPRPHLLFLIANAASHWSVVRDGT